MQLTVRRTNMAKNKKAVQPSVENQVPVTNSQRMSALQEQGRQLEASYQKVQGAIELLQSIIEQEKKDG